MGGLSPGQMVQSDRKGRPEVKIGQEWVGTPPEKCDVCGIRLLTTFVDGRTSDGRWAIMCPSCRVERGPRILGTGNGQKFERKPGQPWVKVAG